MKKNTMRAVFMTVFAGSFGFAMVAQADVTVTRSMSVDGAGAMAFANMSGTSKTTISGNKSRTDSDMKMQSKLVGFLARNAVGPSADIVLLDEDRIDHLMLNKRTYTETSFEQMRAQLQKAADQMESNSERKPASAVDQSKCEWLPAKVSVSRTAEKAQFGGYDAERAIITASQPCQDKESGSICEVAIILDQWMSTGFSENAEVRKFYSAYAAKMGLDQASLEDASQRAKALFSQYQGIWSEVATKLQSMKGYAVKSSFTLALGGAQCKDPKAQQTQSNQGNDDSGSSGGLSGAIAGKLGGLFHKKKDDADAPAAAPAPTTTPVPIPAGDVALMTVSSQLVSVSTDSASPDAFLVPADFKKQELRTQ
ncbi:MAG TPA: hypothetical protein VHW25_05565 [Steroidobacteraceae bacterium]|jgi:hypothetical protein|nr:hypothetical protein [Steroidobacteraceae bacterium]